MRIPNLLFFIITLFSTSAIAHADELGKHGFARSGDIKIHYVSAGEGPLVVMLHGFPDYWYTWRKQMPEIAKNHQVVTVDLRGFNKSDQPDGVENYALPKLHWSPFQTPTTSFNKTHRKW